MGKGKSPLEVGVIGGGVAGLSAAIALKRAGHNIELFERSGFTNESGTTLAIAPNAARVHNSWGIDLEQIGGVETVQVRHVDGATGKTTWQESMKDVPKKYGSKFVFMRHGDIHGALLSTLHATHGFPVKLNLDTKIGELDCREGIIQMPNGSKIKKDLIICSFLKSITEKDCPLLDTGLSFFRYRIPTKEIDDDPLIRPHFDNQVGELCFFHHLASGTSVVTYLCEGGKTRAVNVFGKRAAGKDTEADPRARVTRADLLNMVSGFHPSVKAILLKAPEDAIFSYPLLLRDPLTSYVNDKVAVIGDAAHLFRPQQGQGASISVESAGCLEVLFAGAGKEDVQPRLRLFEKLRLGRCGPIHVFSNMPPGPDGHAWMVEKIKPFWDDSRPLPPPGSRPMSSAFLDFMYAYDVFQESQKALDEFLRQDPNGAIDEKSGSGSFGIAGGIAKLVASAKRTLSFLLMLIGYRSLQ